MNRSQLELDPGLILDARRVAWLEAQRALLVSDLHLGYVWTHRHAGQMLPLGTPDDTLARLALLVSEYQPEQLILLGDILHGDVPVDAVLEELRQLVTGIGQNTRLRLIEGNHDIGLARALRRLGSTLPAEVGFILGPHALMHGHLPTSLQAPAYLAAAQDRKGRVIFGHEHPAVFLSDGIASRARCPCFVAADGALVLPCFTSWSTGGGGGEFFSPLGQALTGRRAIAIVAGKLLPLTASS